MEVLDSRRLTGINIVSDLPGAVIDVAIDDAAIRCAIEAWQDNARAILDAVGWRDEQTFVRRFSGGVSLQITAPIDGWYAACEVNEWAWATTESERTGSEGTPIDEAAVQLRGLIEDERNPRLMALDAAAAGHGVALLSDDERASVGLGRGSLCWAVDELPDPSDIDWASVNDVPVALITGTNGKTTTARLLAKIVASSGAIAGNTSSDGVQIDGDIVLPGDYTGGEGARALLQDRRVDVAILEAARGGLLRRGVPVQRADSALVTNVGLDHMGEFGVADVEELADTKMLVTRAVGKEGRVVLNADDAALVARAAGVEAPIVWIAMSRLSPPVAGHVSAGGEALYVRDQMLVRAHAGRLDELLDIGEIPITFGGAARYNVYNALGAAALAFALGLPADAVTSGLRALEGTAQDNPGRGNFFELEGVQIFVDFAHNPPGVRAVLEMASRLTARRRAVIIGQAGDRDDDSIRELARAVWSEPPDLVVIKELRKYLRGRREGEVPALIKDELERLGAPAGTIEVAGSELEAVQRTLEWSQPGDLLLLLLQERDESLAFLEELGVTRWSRPQAG